MSISTQITVAADAETIVVTAPGALRGPMGDVTPEVTELVERAEAAKDQAGVSAGQAAGSATQAAADAASALDSKTSAMSSAEQASASEIAAKDSEIAAASSEAAAALSETNSAQAAADALASKNAAATSEGNAAASESNAANSAVSASNSATSAAQAAASAAADFENIFQADQLEREQEFDAAQADRDTQFKAQLLASGFELPAIQYVNGTALVIARPTQLIIRDGQLYSVKADKAFPYTLTGTWATDLPNLVPREDNSLRQQLGSASGSSMVRDALLAMGARTLPASELFAETVSLQKFVGYDPTGASDSSAAFKSALAYLATKVRAHAGVSNPACGYELYLPPGDYLITEASALTMLFPGRVIGLTIRAAAGTRIFYRPSTPGPLFVNNDKVLFLRVKGIFFVGEDAGSDFFSSTSNGGAQDYLFDDCVFHGSWNYGMNRKGGNTNSEFKWFNCAWSGIWKVWDYIAADGTSDQFVNNWFVYPKYWSISPWIEYNRGGHIRMVSADISGYSPLQLPAGEGPGGNRTQYLIKLLGRTHSYGVCSLSVFGGRIEQKTQWAGVLYSEWPQGTVTLDAFDASSQAFTDFGASIESFYFSPGNNPGAMIGVTQSELIGYLVFESQITQGGLARVSFDNTSFLTQAFPEDSFIFKDNSNQLGARPVIRLKNVRGRPSQTSVPTYADADLNWQYSVNAQTSNKLISLKSSTGTLPSFAQGGVGVTIPKGAVITKITIYVPPGASGSSSTANYTVVTGESTPRVLATLNLSPISAGGVFKGEPMFVCDTREKASLTLVPSANMNTAQGAGSFCTIEYIG